MYEAFVKGKNLSEAYHNALMELDKNGEVTTCNAYNQLQKELAMTFIADDPLAEPMVSRLIIGGFYELQQYIMEVLDGILDFKIGASENAWEYTYHDRITNYGGELNQLQFVIDELKRSPDSRRAVIDIRDNKVDPFNSHPACLQHMQFLIRGGKLHMKVLMRSNDGVEATFMNAFAFVMIQKKVADALDLPIGTYTHRANSFHCYEKDFGLLDQYITGIKTKPIDEITYEYNGFFQDLMKEAIPNIEKAVKVLRN
ncbi:MAG: thymidylate synthase [Defluviitaleaceae bacterium]|nr:thymidylate synthase [Defluviitaleaceae bacterium]